MFEKDLEYLRGISRIFRMIPRWWMVPLMHGVKVESVRCLRNPVVVVRQPHVSLGRGLQV